MHILLGWQQLEEGVNTEIKLHVKSILGWLNAIPSPKPERIWYPMSLAFGVCSSTVNNNPPAMAKKTGPAIMYGVYLPVALFSHPPNPEPTTMAIMNGMMSIPLCSALFCSAS
jgi:hypothetical protein